MRHLRINILLVWSIIRVLFSFVYTYSVSLLFHSPIWIKQIYLSLYIKLNIEKVMWHLSITSIHIYFLSLFFHFFYLTYLYFKNWKTESIINKYTFRSICIQLVNGRWKALFFIYILKRTAKLKVLTIYVKLYAICIQLLNGRWKGQKSFIFQNCLF